MIHYINFSENVTFMNMAPMAFKKLFTSFEKPTNPAISKLHRLKKHAPLER
jgi:hypothetical protein